MEAALDLVGAGPSAVAAATGRRAVGAADRRVATVVQRVVRDVVLGFAFAAILSRPLSDEGFVFEVPIGILIAVGILAGIAGVLAAIPPALRASRVDVLRAVTTE